MTIRNTCEDPLVLDLLDFRQKPSEVIECSSLEYFGTPYRVNSFVLLPYKADGEKQAIAIGQIKKLLCIGFEPWLLAAQCESIYDKFYDVYSIKDTLLHTLLPMDHLEDYLPLEGYKVGKNQVVTV